jgi:hypothetical protein
MSYFGDFLDEELRLIISIPVRAAFWISQIDDVQDTDRDDDKERLALEKALKKIFAKTDDDAFTNDVIEEALKRKDFWPEWETNAGTVLADIPKAMRLVRDRLPADAVAGYQKTVFYLARVIAQAASEREGDPKSETAGAGLFNKIIDRFAVKTDLKAPDNVSDSEKAALQKLLAALKG